MIKVRFHDLVTLTTENYMRVEVSDRCRVNRVRSEIVISQLLVVPVPTYVFVDSEQKAEFKAKIKPCSHQLNCMKFLL